MTAEDLQSENTLYSKIVNLLKIFLQKLGFVNITDSDIKALLHESYKNLAEETQQPPIDNNEPTTTDNNTEEQAAEPAQPTEPNTPEQEQTAPTETEQPTEQEPEAKPKPKRKPAKPKKPKVKPATPTETEQEQTNKQEENRRKKGKKSVNVKPLFAPITQGDQQNGLYEEYYESGKLALRGYYKDGKPNGLFELWNKNGQLTHRGNYKDDKREGLYERWHDNGELASRANYKNGKLDGLSEGWYENGQPWYRINYKDDKREGLYESWQWNGQLAERAICKNNKLDGLREEWYYNGQLLERANYKNGKKDGLYEEWDEDGTLLTRQEYKDGELVKTLDGNSDIRFRKGSEEDLIVSKAKAEGTFMKAPNGKPTNLTERQWTQVRTQAFKEWFGDWEKAARIEKLKNSEPIEITGKEIAITDDYKQNKKNALDYGKRLRSTYKNNDTGIEISLGISGVKEVLNHDYKNVEQILSVAAIPQIIEESIYIDSANNEDLETNKYVSKYHYYVCGLNIGGENYTVRAVVAEQPNGERYYDHKLTKIEKGKLLDSLSRITTPGFNQEISPISVGKDKRLISILQTNSSKVVDENGEPLVADGLFLNLKENPIPQMQRRLKNAYALADMCKRAEEKTGLSHKQAAFYYTDEGSALLDEEMQYSDTTQALCESILDGHTPRLTVAFRYGEVRDSDRSWNYRDNEQEAGVSVVGRVADMNTKRSGYYEAFFGDSEYNVVIGYDINKNGSDGEILLRNAKVIAGRTILEKSSRVLRTM